MASHDKSGGFTKNTKVDSNTPGTSAATRAPGDQLKNKGKQPSLLHIDRDLRFRRHMIPKRHPMFPMDGPNRMMAPHVRDISRIGGPNFLLRDRRPSVMPARSMFKDSGAQMGPPPPRGFMAPIQGHPKEPKDIPRDFMKPLIDGERRMPGGFPQRQDHMPKHTMDFPGRMMDYPGKQVEPFRKGPYPIPGQPKQEAFARYPDRQMGMPGFGMNKPYKQQGKPVGRFPHTPGRYMMDMPPSYRKIIRFPERYIDLSDYTMDFQGRFMNQQGKYANPLNLARIHQGRATMPVPPPIKQRFMQKPERYMDMSRFTMDFDGHYRDNYGRPIDPMEQFNANGGRYIRNIPPPKKRQARFPERYMDLSRYTMDFQGRLMDTHGKHVDPFGRFHGNYGKVPVNPPPNQRRFIRHPEKYMDMSGYTMDFQGRFLDRRGRPIDLLGRHLSHPGRFMLPSPGMQHDVPMIPRRLVAPPLKPIDLSRYSMDFEGRLMDNHGRYVDQMRRFDEHLVPRPQYSQRNFMDFYNGPVDQFGKIPALGPEPNIFFERRGSPELRPTSVPEKVPPMEPDPIIPEKDYNEIKTRPDFPRSRSPGGHRVEFQETPRPQSVSPTPSEEEALMLLEDEHMQMPFMKFPMPPSMYTGMRSSLFSIPEDCFQMPPQMMQFNYEMFMPVQQPSADNMVMEMMNTGYPLYPSMRTSFGAPESDYTMNKQHWFLSDCQEFMDNEMPYRHDRLTTMMAPGMHMQSPFRMANEPRQQSLLPSVMGCAVDEPRHEEQRSSRFEDRQSQSMESREFDFHNIRFGQHDDWLMPEVHQTTTNGLLNHGDQDDYMFNGGNYLDYHMGEFYPEGFMPSPPIGFMNDFQSPFWFDPECMGMQPGFVNEPGFHPYLFMNDNFGFGYYDNDEDEERNQEEKGEEEGEEIRHHMRKHCEGRRTPSPTRSPNHRSPSPHQGEGDIEAETQRRMTRPRGLLGDEEHFLDDKHARYLEEAAECLRERGRFLREQHERFLQELENTGPLSHPQIQAEAEAHAHMVEEEVNSTEAEAEAVEKLARTARRVSNAENHCALFGSRHHFVDSPSRYPHKHMDEH